MNKSDITFEAFITSKTRCDNVGEVLGDDMDNGHGGPVKGFLYFECLYIEEMDNGQFFLNIERSDWIDSDIRALEARLFIFAQDDWS